MESSVHLLMRRYFSFRLHWLLVIIPLLGTVGAVSPPTRGPNIQLTTTAPLTIGETRPGENNDLFTKPSSTAQEYILKEEHRSKRANPLARMRDIAALVRQQHQGWKWQWQQVPPLSFRLSFPRKMAPPPSSDDPFFS